MVALNTIDQSKLTLVHPNDYTQSLCPFSLKFLKCGRGLFSDSWSRDQLSVNTKTVRFWQILFQELKTFLELGNFQPYISKVEIATAADSEEDLYRRNNSCQPVTSELFSVQILVNFEIFKLS